MKGALVFMAVAAGGVASARAGVEVVPKPAEKRVDVLVDGRPFTAHVWPDRLKKPVLFPLRTARGTLVTRGFPLGRGRASASITRTTWASGSTTAT